jgi:hypothetical protein
MLETALEAGYRGLRGWTHRTRYRRPSDRDQNLRGPCLPLADLRRMTRASRTICEGVQSQQADCLAHGAPACHIAKLLYDVTGEAQSNSGRARDPPSKSILAEPRPRG